MDLLKRKLLNDMSSQDSRQSIIQEQGHILVLGGPGSGKTTIALKKALSYHENLNNHQKVLFLSFSKSAIKQISDRSKDVLSNKNASIISLQTYHSFCWEVLRSHHYFLTNTALIKILLPHQESILENTFGGKDWSDEVLRLFHEEGKIVFDLFAQMVSNLFDSDRLLKLYCDAFPLIIVDEFQDSDKDQWNIIKRMSKYSQIMCLADNEQRIYDWRAGVSSKRISDVREFLRPQEFDFESENFRSPDSSIIGFANDMINGNPLVFPDDKSIIRMQYNGRNQIPMIKLAIYDFYKSIPKNKKDWSIAILVRTNQFVRTISNGLNESHTFAERIYKPIPHSVLIDEKAVIMSGRIIASILQPLNKDGIIPILDLFIEFNQSNGSATSIKKANSYLNWRQKLNEGKPVNTNLVKELKAIVELVHSSGYLIGDPFTDWLKVRNELESSSVTEIVAIAKTARQMSYLRRGSQITDSLSADWKDNGSYLRALNDFDRAVYSAQISESYSPTTGVILMNIHKSKGKEFDYVLVVDGMHNNALTNRDRHPYTDTKRLVRVAITRARKRAIILDCRQSPCELLN